MMGSSHLELFHRVTPAVLKDGDISLFTQHRGYRYRAPRASGNDSHETSSIPVIYEGFAVNDKHLRLRSIRVNASHLCTTCSNKSSISLLRSPFRIPISSTLELFFVVTQARASKWAADTA